jgi:hypothetical protein
MKTCTTCSVEQPIENYWRHPHGKDGRQAKCIECTKAVANTPYSQAKRRARQKKSRATDINSRARTMRSSGQKGARQRDLEFLLDLEWYVEKLEVGTCEMTGIPFVLDPDTCEHTRVTKLNRRLNPFAPSVDRIDSEKGYTEDNCVMTCYMYNLCKQSFSDEAIVIFAEKFLENN